jgi:hypothetical protein
MNRILLFIICIIVITTSCSRESAPDNFSKIYERLHGKYKVMSSFSSEAVDVNMDGAATTNILTEIPDLKNCDLEIRIVNKDNFLIDPSWPEQLITGVLPATYDPSRVVHYVRQGLTYTFTFDELNARLNVKPNQQPQTGPIQYSFPAVVTVEAPDTIKLEFSKKLYTSAGWKTVVITTVYKRYTMTT